MTKSRTQRNGDNSREVIGDCVSIYLRGKTWWASFQLNRHQQRQSLDTPNKKEARRKALILAAELQTGALEMAPPPAPLEEVIHEYLEHLKTEGRSLGTLTKYTQVYEQFQKMAATRGIGQVSQVDLRFVDWYRCHRAKSGSAPKTIQNATTIIKQLINFARSRKIILKDPLEGLKNPRPKRTEQPCWTKLELERIISAAKDPHKSVYIALANTGMRIGELQWLTWEDIDWGRNLLLIRKKEGWKPKSGDSRSVPMAPQLRVLLERLPRRFRWVFTAAPSRTYPQGDHQISERRLLQSLKALLKRMGLPTDGKLHTFRHTFISLALMEGVAPAIVRSWVGHVSDEILAHYTHIHHDPSQEAMLRLCGDHISARSSTDLAQSPKGASR